MSKTYLLRTCDTNLRSYNNFQWPQSGFVKCPDWSPKQKCGNGLHGLVNGDGNYDLLDWSSDAKWLVWSTEEEIINLNRKAKAKSGFVEFVGGRKEATDFIISKGANPSKVVGAFLFCEANEKLFGADLSTLTGGDGSTLTGGNESTLTGGYMSTLTGGYGSTLTFYYCLNNFKRTKTIYVGEDGILPNVAYKLDKNYGVVKA